MTDPLLRIVVHGQPAPAGSKRAFRNQYTGRIQQVESSKKAPVWRDAVLIAALRRIRCCDDPDCTRLRDGYPLDQAVTVSMVFTVPKPASAPKTRRVWPVSRPDVVKLARSTEDALTDAGVWREDSRVVDYTRLAKVFPREDPDALEVPGVVICVWRTADLVIWQRDAAVAEPAGTLFEPVQLS